MGNNKITVEELHTKITEEYPVPTTKELSEIPKDYVLESLDLLFAERGLAVNSLAREWVQTKSDEYSTKTLYVSTLFENHTTEELRDTISTKIQEDFIKSTESGVEYELEYNM